MHFLPWLFWRLPDCTVWYGSKMWTISCLFLSPMWRSCLALPSTPCLISCAGFLAIPICGIRAFIIRFVLRRGQWCACLVCWSTENGIAASRLRPCMWCWRWRRCYCWAVMCCLRDSVPLLASMTAGRIWLWRWGRWMSDTWFCL